MEEYSKVRNKDAEAICDMSMDNYLEVLYTKTHHYYYLTTNERLQELIKII